MSWMPPELAISPEDRKHRCDDCGFMKWAEEFTDNVDYYDNICNDCNNDRKENEENEDEE